MITKDYIVLVGCEIAGVWRDKGARVPLSAAQAEHLAPPFGSVVVPAGEVKALPKARKVRARGRLDRN